MSYVIEHEGPRVFVVYRIDGDSKVEVERFKTNHSAKKKYGHNLVLSEGKPSKSNGEKREKSGDLTRSVIEHCGRNTIGAWKRAMKGNSRKSSIRAFCLMCVGGNAKDVRDCASVDCPLHKFRITG
jgi:hypothetical protein